MDSRTLELVSNAPSQLYPNNTLSSFTNFLPEQVNLDGQCSHPFNHDLC